MNPTLALSLLCVCASVSAQTAPPAPAEAPAPASTGRYSEPNVKSTVIEDEGSRIDELVVRGQVQHVVVTPKVGTTRRYEIIVGRGGRESADGTGGANSAVGKRVWNVLAF
jgi:hypothetical protein